MTREHVDIDFPTGEERKDNPEEFEAPNKAEDKASNIHSDEDVDDIRRNEDSEDQLYLEP